MALSHFLHNLVALVGALDIETVSNRMIQIEIQIHADKTLLGVDKTDINPVTNTSEIQNKEQMCCASLHFLCSSVGSSGKIKIKIKITDVLHDTNKDKDKDKDKDKCNNGSLNLFALKMAF